MKREREKGDMILVKQHSSEKSNLSDRDTQDHSLLNVGTAGSSQTIPFASLFTLLNLNKARIKQSLTNWVIKVARI